MPPRPAEWAASSTCTRDHPFREVVDPLEVRRAPTGQLAPQEEMLERHPAEAPPVPPFAVAPARVRELPGGQRALARAPRRTRSRCSRHAPHETRRVRAMRSGLSPYGPPLRHSPPEQRMVVDREQRDCMAPVFEQLAAGAGQVVQQADVVRAHPAEQHQELRSLHDIDRVELELTDRGDRRLQSALPNRPGLVAVGPGPARRPRAAAPGRSTTWLPARIAGS